MKKILFLSVILGWMVCPGMSAQQSRTWGSTAPQTFVRDEGDLAICHHYGELVITNNPYTGDIVISDMNGKEVFRVQPVGTPQYISLDGLPVGNYKVIFNKGQDGQDVRVFTVMDTHEFTGGYPDDSRQPSRH